jgi:glycerate kinase
LAEGAERVIVAVGGSATTDGGLGAVEALGRRPFVVPVQIACDVRTAFRDAATVFGPQKGATPEQVARLTERLDELAGRYRRELAVDVSALPGAGAAGGLAGGLAALGATLEPGLALVAERVGLARALERVDLVLTGEGKLDATSLDGKVVGGVLEAAAARGLTAAVVAGQIDAETEVPVPAVSLVERFGEERAWHDTAPCIAEAAAELTRSARS